MLTVQKLQGGYGENIILENISFQVERGELFGILGPNGSGKTTLLKMISGILPRKSGTISIRGKGIEEYSRKQLAQMIAVLSQHSVNTFSYTVKETVSLGRYAHQKGFFHTWQDKDEEIVKRVMEQTGITSLQDKNIQELSGGERQRVFLAQALTQEPEILLLDEPTNHLDLSYQKDLLDLLKEWTKNKGLTVISIFHDINLASLYCDRLLLMDKGHVHINDIPNEVIKVNRIQEVFGTETAKHPHPVIPVPQIVLLPQWENKENNRHEEVKPELLHISKEHIVLKSPFPLRTMSSSVIGAGVGWYQTFVNRHVERDYICIDYRKDMVNYLQKNGFEASETIAMMTAVHLEDVATRFLSCDDISVFTIVTAGTGDAVDASKSGIHSSELLPGTINIWIFINGKLTEEAFIQSVMSATEAKVKALEKLNISDSLTGTIATGTATDSILIAATQKGELLEFAGTVTPLGKLITRGVYECTTEAIQNSLKRKDVETKKGCKC